MKMKIKVNIIILFTLLISCNAEESMKEYVIRNESELLGIINYSISNNLNTIIFSNTNNDSIKKIADELSIKSININYNKINKRISFIEEYDSVAYFSFNKAQILEREFLLFDFSKQRRNLKITFHENASYSSSKIISNWYYIHYGFD